MKKFIILCISFLLVGCNQIDLSKAEHKDSITIVTASDPHYYSASLTDYGVGFLTITEKGDGKLLSNSDLLIDALIQKAIDSQADYLLLTGDLTFNGELASHEDLSKKLKTCEEKGIEVFVIPGNHDLNSIFSRQFFEDKYYSCDTIDEAKFKEIYHDFGYSDTYMDDETLSYMAPLSDDVWLLSLDCNGYKQYEGVSDHLLDFVDDCLKMAEEKNAKVITMSHENILVHNDYFSSYAMRDHQKLFDLLNDYQIPLNLSGHMHIQHSKDENGMLEIAQSSLSIPTHNCGIVQIEKEGLIYQLDHLDIEMKESIDFFEANTVRKFQKQSDELSLSEQEKETLLNFMVKFNDLYFSGHLYEEIDDLLQSDGYKLCLQVKDDFSFANYVIESLKSDIHDEQYFAKDWVNK